MARLVREKCDVIVSLPISVLIIIMQRFYVEGITTGSVKG